MCPSPEEFPSYSELQAAVNELANGRKEARLFHFSELKRSNPGAAPQFVSSFLNAQSSCEISLIDPDSGDPLDIPQTLQALQADLEGRAAVANNLPQTPGEGCPSQHADLSRQAVWGILYGAALDPVPGRPTPACLCAPWMAPRNGGDEAAALEVCDDDINAVTP